MLFTDIPASFVIFKMVKRVFPVSSICSQYQGRIMLHKFDIIFF